MNYRHYSVLELLDMIADTSGSKAKIELIKAIGSVNEDFKQTLHYAYTPHYNYGVKKFEAGDCFERWPDGKKLSRIYRLFLPLLYNRELTGNRALEKLMLTTCAMNVDDVEVLRRILDGNLKAGFGVSSINKAFPGFIDTYKVSLCERFSKKFMDDMPYPCMAEVKQDAMRVSFHISKVGNVIAKAGRSGKPIPLPEEFANVISKFHWKGEPSIVVDGEIHVLDKNGKMLSRQKSNGVINKVMKGTASIDQLASLKAVVWDILTEEHFQAGEGTVTNIKRFQGLKDRVNQINDPRVEIVEHTICNNFDEVLQYFQYHILRKEEGIVVKNPNSLWRNKRTKDWIKIKAEYECDMYVAGVCEGTGRLTGKLGSLTCESKDGLVTVSVGSGFNDKQRTELFNKDTIGKVVSVKHSGLLETKGEFHLYCPIFLGIRVDKDEADDLAAIKEEKLRGV